MDFTSYFNSLYNSFYYSPVFQNAFFQNPVVMLFTIVILFQLLLSLLASALSQTSDY